MSVNKCVDFYKCIEEKKNVLLGFMLPSPSEKKPFSLLH